MSHELEITTDQKTGKPVAHMAWNGEKPWHTLGEDVTGLQLTPIQMLEKARSNFLVEKVPSFATINQKVNNQAEIDKILAHNAKGKKLKPVPEYKEEWKLQKVQMAATALVRTDTGAILDEVTGNWEPVQNHEAMEFFDEFVMAGDMEMETVGSLKGGRIVWGLARVKDSFELFKGDQVNSYLLFTNFLQYGYSTDVRFTPIRVVCNNTLTLSLSSDVDRMVKYSHRRQFKPELVKQMLGVSKQKLDEYKKMAAFLGSKKAKPDDVISYFQQVLPGSKDRVKKTDTKYDFSDNAAKAFALLDIQPGADYAKGTWWQPFNAVTFFLDHFISRTADQRLKQAWYGSHKTIKTTALEKALEFANAA